MLHRFRLYVLARVIDDKDNISIFDFSIIQTWYEKKREAISKMGRLVHDLTILLPRFQEFGLVARTLLHLVNTYFSFTLIIHILKYSNSMAE